MGSDPLARSIEAALQPGAFMDWRASSAFTAGLELVKHDIDALAGRGDAARAAKL